jgi:ABC-2 type transport system permease protein
MINATKAEFRKLLTVRSTYVILLLSLVLELINAFYANGYKASPAVLHDPTILMHQAAAAVEIISVLIAICGVLLVTHEYRYNTIMHSLTLARSRSQVFFAKITAISLFAVVFIALFTVLSPLLTLAGIHVHGLHLVNQELHLSSLWWRALFGGWAFVMLATILALLIRIQVGAIVALFLVPGTIEGLLGLLLKRNQVYLPFASVGEVLSHNSAGYISYAHAAAVALAWIVTGLIVALVLFERRDAN